MAEASTSSDTSHTASSSDNSSSVILSSMRAFYGYIFGDGPHVRVHEDTGAPEPEVFEQDSRSQLVTLSSAEEDSDSEHDSGAEQDLQQRLEEAQKDVCKFFVRGQCRFGDKCFNAHPPNLAPSHSKLSPNSQKRAAKQEKKRARAKPAPEEAVSRKKKSMKTALDVIKRIQWDKLLPAELYTIGYVDRFEGVQEEPFQRFSHWGDLPNAEPDELAVPQHRIQYFKYRGVKVWDKSERLDEVFGSVNPAAVGIQVFMDQVDEQLKHDRRPATINEADTASSSPSHSDSESDSDSDDQLAVSIGQQAAIAAPACSIPEEERSTHFLAIRVTNNAVVETARRVQDHVVAQELALSECCMKPELFHITISMLRLPNQQGIDEMSVVVDKMRPHLRRLVADHDLKLRLRGLDTFGQRVLFAKVQPDRDEAFWEFISRIKNMIAATSSAVQVSDKFDFTPHMTLIKVNRPISRLRRSKYLPSALYESFIDQDFGSQRLNNLQLCVIEASTRFDGFYRTINDVTV